MPKPALKILLRQLDSYRSWGKLPYSALRKPPSLHVYEPMVSIAEEIVKSRYSISGLLPSDMYVNHRKYLLVDYRLVLFAIAPDQVLIYRDDVGPNVTDRLDFHEINAYIRDRLS